MSHNLVTYCREMEVLDITTRKRVLGDPDMLDIVFSYLDPPSVKTVRRVSTYVFSMIMTVYLLFFIN